MTSDQSADRPEPRATAEGLGHLAAANGVLRRSRRTWRVLAFLALAIAVTAIAGRFALAGLDRTPDHIARVVINGVITTDAARLRKLTALAEDERVRAVIVSINSGGGTTAGGEELYEALSHIRAGKPVVAAVHEVGASAAYMTAIAADRIFARRLSIVGSIGVLYQHVNAGRLLDTIGIELDKVQTGPLKAEPDLDDPLAGAARDSLQQLVNDSFEWFVDVVAERRSLERGAVLTIADGRIVTGRMGLDLGLIDAIGSEAEAVAWLEAERGIAADLPVLTHFPPPLSDIERVLRFVGGEARSAVGLGEGSAFTLDGLVSLWQAETTR